MGLNTIGIRKALPWLLFSLFAVIGCGQQSATQTAPEPNVGPAGPPQQAPATGEKAPAR